MSEPKINELMEKIVSLCKRRGFIFQSSEIYGGINGFWDYGPLGAELKRNVKDAWWRSMTRDRDDVVGLDASIIMHPKIWEASGHTSTFSDPMVDCLLTKKRFRADQIEPQSGKIVYFTGALEAAVVLKDIDERLPLMSDEEKKRALDLADKAVRSLKNALRIPKETVPALQPMDLSFRQYEALGHKTKIVSKSYSVLISGENEIQKAVKTAEEFYRTQGLFAPIVRESIDSLLVLENVENTQRYNPENGSLLTEPRAFNLMFKTYVGPVESEDNVAYLRPETAQAIFAQFKNVVDSSRVKIPVRYRPDRQSISQRNQPAQFHLPLPRVRADGTRILHQARRNRQENRRAGDRHRNFAFRAPHSAIQLGLGGMAQVLGRGARAVVREHWPGARLARFLSSAQDRTGPLRQSHCGHSLQVSLRRAGT